MLLVQLLVLILFEQEVGPRDVLINTLVDAEFRFNSHRHLKDYAKNSKRMEVSLEFKAMFFAIKPFHVTIGVDKGNLCDEHGHALLFDSRAVGSCHNRANYVEVR